MHPIIGIDFDNTIVCYDTVFTRVAYEKKLVPATVKPTKEAVRDYLRSIGREDDWTELQGFVYGKCMSQVAAFPGVMDFFTSAIGQGFDVFIISHKTPFPYRGPRCDLHQAAMEWLELLGFFDQSKIGLSRQHVFFEISKAGKLGRIAQMQCTHYIDDLPEILTDALFPEKTMRMLFAPDSPLEISDRTFSVFKTWHEISRYFNLAG